MKIKDRAKPKIPAVEPGVYMAVCIGVIDLGEQYSEKFKTYANKCLFLWELPTELIEIDGENKPRQLSKEFTISSSKKANMRSFLESWNGKSYSDDEFGEVDLFDQIGKPCQLQVVLSESGEYSNVANLMPLPKGLTAPESVSEPVRWDMQAWDDEIYDKLPEWIQEKIKHSGEYQKEHAPTDEIKVEASAPQRKAECPI